MDAFAYLSVLISIILGLGITRLLTGLGHQIEFRGLVRGYWPALAWAIVLLLLHVQTWWSMFGMRAFEQWAFHDFAVVLLQPIVLYLLAVLVLPSPGTAASIDLKQHYHAQRRWFFGLFATLLIVSLVKDLALMGHLPDPVNLAFHLVFLGLSLAAIAIYRAWFHRAFAALMLMLFTTYIALLFPTLV